MKKLIILLSASALLTASCADEKTKESSDAKAADSSKTTQASGPVTIEKVTEGPEYADAQLILGKVTTQPVDNTDSVDVTFNFNVKNYELKAQTPDATSRSCNNSKEGQHIHFILNHQPYTALYEPTHTVRLKKGSEHSLLSFLSRSYHLSVKNPNAYIVSHFRIDDSGQFQKTENKVTGLFFSRPKGTYLGDDTKEVLLDFYLVDVAERVKNGEYVIKADIGGTALEINEWAPYVIKGLPMGKHKVSLKMVDAKSGQLIGDNDRSLEITLAEKEPIAP